MYQGDDVSDSEDDPCCRICRQGEEAGKLYCPCRCAGSIKWIHESCLRVWLRAQDRQPTCELCGYGFEFLPVYAQHAPHRLTIADWADAFGTSAFSIGKRLLRVVYATVVWGMALPLLTVYAAYTMFGCRSRLPASALRSMLPLTLNIFLGECLSLAGIALIYLISIARGLAAAAPATAADVAAVTTAATASAVSSLQPVPAEADAPDSPSSAESSPVAVPAVSEGSAVSAQAEAATAASPPDAPASALVRSPAAEVLVAASEEEAPMDPEEDLWNILGLQGNPLRAVFCMATFLCANMIGIALFLAIPFFLGRSVMNMLVTLAAARRAAGLPAMAWLLDLADAVSDADADAAGLMDSAGGANGSRIASTPYFRELPGPGHSPLLDITTLALGYVGLVAALLTVMPCAVLVAVASGYSARGPEVMRVGFQMAIVQAHQLASQAWVKLQMFAVVVLQLLLVPTYIGHLVICMLCGPVLHLPQHARASMANANMPLTLVMQLFIGYVHLWGIAFLEGCLAEVFRPTLISQASHNFFVGAVCSHRRLFGTGSQNGSSMGAPLLIPHAEALKLALVHIAFHTPLAFVLWQLPACFLDRALGKVLFPVNLVDPAAGGMPAHGDLQGWESAAGAPGQEVATSVGQSRGALAPQPADGQPFFAIEMLQLYILILQCLRVLDASPGLARLISHGLRSLLQRLGLGHVLADRTSAEPPSLQVEEAASSASRPPPAAGGALGNVRETAGTDAEEDESLVAAATPRPARVQSQQSLAVRQLLMVVVLLISLAWVMMFLVLALPLSVGRALVYHILATQAKRISDFLPLSLGVVVSSAVILAVVKISEALPAISQRVTMLENRRCLHLLVCTASSAALGVAVLMLIPLGLGTLLLRIVLPMKAASVHQVPIVFPLTDCWSLGLVLTKVIWRLVQTDVVLHDLHTEFLAAWSEAQGSLTILFLDTRAHRRIWRSLVLPLLDAIVVHLVFPRAAAHTLIACCIPEDQELLRSAVLMFCYHLVLCVRLWSAFLPVAQQWIVGVRQRIFDAKYLVSTELQNYHPLDQQPSLQAAESM